MKLTTLICVLLITSTAYAAELGNYRVTGENLHTGLRVVGMAWEQDREGSLKAKVYDMMSTQDECNGSWVGKGVMQVGCGNGHQYVLEVVE